MSGRHVGLVGCGGWGRYILRDLVTLGCEVTAVTRSEQGRRNAVEYGAHRIVGRLEDLPAVEGAVVATSSSTHAEVIDALLPRGVPVFVEKPLCPDPVAAVRLAELAPDHLFVMDKWRYHPGIELLRDLARSGQLGEVVGLRSTRIGWGNPHDDADAIWHLAPHDLAIALEILGEIPTPRSAVADRDGSLPTGLVGLLGGSDGAPWVALEVSARSRERRREVRLFCRDAVAVLADGYAPEIAIHRWASEGEAASFTVERRPLAGAMPLLRELRAFTEHLGGGPPPRSSAREGASIVLAIAELRRLAGLAGGATVRP